MQFLKTNRLFFNKWPYKIECVQEGANRIKRNGLDFMIEWSEGRILAPWDHYAGKYDKKKLGAFCKTVKKFADKDIQTRSEGAGFNIFCKDTALFEEMSKAFECWITAVSRPENEEELKFLLETKHTNVLCDEYPWGSYQYKIVLNERMPTHQRQAFLSWIEKYPFKIRAPNGAKKWLDSTWKYVQDPFIYIQDKPMLTMTLLYLGSNSKKVYEYILKSSINTPCPH